MTPIVPSVARGRRQPAANKLDVATIRRDFPILKQQINGHPLVYLDNAATAQKPRCVIDAVIRHYETDNANIHRGVHTLSVRSTKNYEAARVKVRDLLGAARAEEIIFVRGATEGINLVAQSYARSRLREGDEIVISTMEHHSNIVPWQLVCEQTGARLRVVPIGDDGSFLFEEYEKLLGKRTKIVAVTHVSNALGTINPVREITEAAHRGGAVILIDGAQAVPHLRVNVREIGCDFYTVSGHKFFAPTGSGVVYGRFDLLDAMPPYQGGGEMIKAVTFEKTVYNDVPHKFEAGTPNIAGAIGFGAAVDYVTALGFEAIDAHERALLRYGTEVLSSIPQLRLIGTSADKAAVFSFVLDGVHAHDIGTILDQQGIAVRTGHHCAQPVMDRFGVSATCRASLAFYNTKEEIDVLATGLRRVVEVFA